MVQAKLFTLYMSENAFQADRPIAEFENPGSRTALLSFPNPVFATLIFLVPGSGVVAIPRPLSKVKVNDDAQWSQSQ